MRSLCADFKQVGDKNIGVRRMKVATRYLSGKSDGELLIAAGAGDRNALVQIPACRFVRERMALTSCCFEVRRAVRTRGVRRNERR